MDLVYAIPDINGVYTQNRWVESNDAEINLSEIKITKTHCIVPMHIVEDCLIEDDYLSEKGIEENRHVLYPVECFDYIQNVRRQGYKACIWYPEIQGRVPTASSVLLDTSTLENMKKNIENNVENYPFVRLCTMSAKDQNPNLVYNRENHDKAINDFFSSNRTNDVLKKPYCDGIRGKHLFMREKRDYVYEARCFWSRDKLRAVSISLCTDFTSEDENEIIEFFNRYGREIPYHSAVVDIGKTNSGIELIEFNTFGPDMKATAGKFSWYEDVITLLNSPAPVFR